MFETPEITAKLQRKLNSDITPFAKFDFISLDPLGVGKKIKEYFLDIGCECLLLINESAYSELCLEFHDTSMAAATRIQTKDSSSWSKKVHGMPDQSIRNSAPTLASNERPWRSLSSSLLVTFSQAH